MFYVLEACPMQRCVSLEIFHVNICPELYQQPDYRCPTPYGCYMQGGHPFPIVVSRVSTGLNQQASALGMSLLGGSVERRAHTLLINGGEIVDVEDVCSPYHIEVPCLDSCPHLPQQRSQTAASTRRGAAQKEGAGGGGGESGGRCG